MKIKALFLASLLIAMTGFTCFAQTNPCGDGDPDTTCPLDTWVLVLVAGGLVFATIQLYRRQKLGKIA